MYDGARGHDLTKSIMSKWLPCHLSFLLYPPHWPEEISYHVLKEQMGLSQHNNSQRKVQNEKTDFLTRNI